MAFDRDLVPMKIGMATANPSGILCRPIAQAMPKPTPASSACAATYVSRPRGLISFKRTVHMCWKYAAAIFRQYRQLPERTLMENIDIKVGSNSKLQISSILFIRICSKNRDTVENRYTIFTTPIIGYFCLFKLPKSGETTSILL